MSRKGERLSEMPIAQKAAEVRRLRAEGLTWDEIKAMVAKELNELAVPTSELAGVLAKRDGSLG